MRIDGSFFSDKQHGSYIRHVFLFMMQKISFSFFNFIVVLVKIAKKSLLSTFLVGTKKVHLCLFFLTFCFWDKNIGQNEFFFLLFLNVFSKKPTEILTSYLQKKSLEKLYDLSRHSQYMFM